MSLYTICVRVSPEQWKEHKNLFLGLNIVYDETGKEPYQTLDIEYAKRYAIKLTNLYKGYTFVICEIKDIDDTN